MEKLENGEKFKNGERRRHERVRFSTTIVLTAAHARIEAKGTSKDLSLNGVFVNTDIRLEPGTLCDLTIVLTGGGDDVELSMRAKVERELASGLGISFEAMDIDTYSHLKNIMLYNSNE
ncbi:MAG: PilZ domain-containing protein [Desulfobacterium sp.]|jgi:hypothetical protein|nr:PilZ domain-containing protein [Desulfobacterium sp.]